jgi:hypothetical protein
MASQLGILREDAPSLRDRSATSRLHLVIDADIFWLPASAKGLGAISGLLKGNPGIELTLITREPAWDTCLTLTELPWVLPHHLIAEYGGKFFTSPMEASGVRILNSKTGRTC